MKISIISGSHRSNSQSSRMARIIEERLQSRQVQTEVITLAGNLLPLWDEEFWSNSPKWAKLWDPISASLQSSDGFVVVSPEWGGMVPSGLKNFFLFCTKGELAHKPGYIVSVSSGINGAYPVAELRMSSYKNNKICYLPEHLIIRNAPSALLNPAEPTEADLKVLERMDYGLDALIAYATALRPVWTELAAQERKLPYGM